MGDHVRVAIVGAGFGGLGTAARLKERGDEDFVVLERRDDVGGTWLANAYPGCRCDIPSHLYSFSFAPNPEWSETYSPQPEIWAYLRRVAEERSLLPHIRFGCDVAAMAWDDEAQLWRLDTSQGELTAQAVVAAPGGLSEPRDPDIPGLATFTGTVFHSATWDHDHDLGGERVAVIGTGASAIQFVPKIQPEVGRLDLYQRTPPWITPHRNRPIRRAEHRLYRTLPAAQQAVRATVWALRELILLGMRGNLRVRGAMEKLALDHLRKQVPDPELRTRLTPDYAIGCKRILVSDDYYPAVSAPNVDLITDGIREVRGNVVVAGDGTEREVDTLIFGTGFQVTNFPVAEVIRGRGGRLLADEWADGVEAHRGTTVTGFPNLFVLTGPNTGLGHNSMVYMIESQLRYVLDALERLRAADVAALDVRPEAQRAWNEGVQRQMEGTVWVDGGCSSWYLDPRGRNVTLWPHHTFRFRERVRRFDVEHYDVEAPRAAPVAA